MREVVGRRELARPADGRAPTAEEAAASLCSSGWLAYRFGIAVRDVSFQDIHPPLAVLDAYRDVSRATSDRQRRVNEATTYRDQVVTEAGGEARADPARRGRRPQPPARVGGRDQPSSVRLARARRAIRPDRSPISASSGRWSRGAFAGKDKLLLDEESGRRRHLIVPGLSWTRRYAGGPTIARRPGDRHVDPHTRMASASRPERRQP